MTVAVYFGPALATYGFGDTHPFGNDRLTVFWDEAVRRGLDKRVLIRTPVQADDTDLLRFHTPEYFERLCRLSETGQGFLDYGDTPAFKGVLSASKAVAGCVIDAARAILTDKFTRAFIPIAGLHHARRESAAGFCAINDVGILIEFLRAKHGIKRIAYIDIDAHHGDGVFYSYEEDPDLYFIDLHEDGRYLYPGTGAADETGKGAASGSKLNIPMAPGADDNAFLQEWPRVEEFVQKSKPEFIILQAGADSMKGDPITHLAYTPAVHAHASGRLCILADKLCNGHLIALGGGGYNRNNLAQVWCAVVEAMLEN